MSYKRKNLEKALNITVYIVISSEKSVIHNWHTIP